MTFRWSQNRMGHLVLVLVFLLITLRSDRMLLLTSDEKTTSTYQQREEEPNKKEQGNSNNYTRIGNHQHNVARTATIVVQMSGEMGNNLHHLAAGIALQQMAREMTGIDCNVVIRHDEGRHPRLPQPKWVMSRDRLQRCFPVLRDWDFEQGNTAQFDQAQMLQTQWLNNNHNGKMDELFGLINSSPLEEIAKGLRLLEDMLTDPERPLWDPTSIVRIPYILSTSLDTFPLIDRYFTDIENVFAFNETACCAENERPTSAESVFHFRNYISEMPRWRAYDSGFSELSPNKTAHELFRRLGPGDSVRITTRVVNQKARNYVEALQEKHVNATLLAGQSDVEDFCFLKRTTHQLVGNARSTFVQWAGLLGEQNSMVRLYHVDNEGLRQRHPDFWERFTYNFTHPRLRDRISFELYKAEELT